MCYGTKRKIADGLLEMMHEKTLRKITVQDIMDCKSMKRQSFYYHFQDIYDVMEWICSEEFLKPAMFKEDESFEEWICGVFRLIQENGFFYRKVLENIERERVIKKMYSIVKEQVEKRIFIGRDQNPMVVHFAVQSVCHFILDSVAMKKRMQEEELLEAVRNIKRMFKQQTAPVVVLSSHPKTMTA